MKAKLRDLTMNLDGSQNITVTVYGYDFREKMDQLKDKWLDVEIKQHRDRRSKDANAYFHVLINKIAMETKESDEEVKTRLVQEYGVLDRLENGLIMGFMLLQGIDPPSAFPYVRNIGQKVVDGKTFNQWVVLKHTHEMDTKEMARLIDGAIAEAKELGIETETPEELARLQELWERYERKQR